jgi:PAS domain S-box-containing protein
MVRFFKSLRFRLILLVVVALLPTVGVIIHNAMVARREDTAATKDQLRRLVTLVAREQEQKTMAARQMLMGLAQAPAVRRQEAEACSALFAQLISKPSLFINIGAVDRDGNIFASGVPMPGPLNSSGWRYFQKAMKTRDFAVGDLQFGRITLKPILIFGYPLLDTTGEVQTVLYASIGLDWLQELAVEARLPAGSILAIIDEQGAIMAKYPDPGKWVGKHLPPGGLFDIMQKSGEGMAEAQGMDGVPRVYVFIPLGREPQLGFAYAGIPISVVYSAADQALRRNLVFLAGVLLLGLALAWGFGYLFIMRRLNPLVQATGRLAAGDLAVRTGLTGGPDELSQLAQAFDHLAASLQKREAERRQAEEARRESEAQLQSILDNSSTVVFLKDLEGRYITVNQRYEELFHVTRQTVVGKSDHDIFPREHADRFRQHDLLALEKGGPFQVEELVPQDDGLHTYISVKFPLLGADGKPYAVCGIATDITARKQAEEALKHLHHQHQLILSSAAEGILGLDLEGKHVFVNSAATKMLGYEAEELIGSPSHATWHHTRVDGSLYSEEECPLCMTLKKGTPSYETSEVFWRKDGTCFSVDCAAAPIIEDGKVSGSVITFWDISARREAEEAFKFLVSHAPMGIFIIQGGKYILINPGFETITGYRKEELLGHESECLAVPLYKEIVREEALKRLKGESSTPFEFQFVTKSGETRWGLETIAPTQYEGKRAVLGYFMDITPQKQLQEQFLQAQKMEAVGTLAGGIAHDFNNILTAILGNIGLAVLDAKTNPQVQDRLAQTEAACLRAQGLSQQLLAFAKGGAPVTKLCSVAELLTESTAFTCIGSPVKCETNFLENLWWIEADPGQISQVFQNLTINAMQAMPTGGTIKVWAENLTLGTESGLPLSAGRYIKISVRDQGIGIQEEHLPRIFDPYFTTKHKGSGLGLASVYAIIKKHHGHIAVESKPGVETTFDIYLPAVERQVSPQPEEDRGLLVGKGKILVMDDEEMVREVLGRMLVRLGYEAEFAGDGGEAIERFVQAHGSGQAFAAVILDLTVPGGMGGKEALGKLLEIDPQVKAVVSSGYSDDPIMANFQKYGFSGVIAKPYRISELGKILNQVIMKKA